MVTWLKAAGCYSDKENAAISELMLLVDSCPLRADSCPLRADSCDAGCGPAVRQVHTNIVNARDEAAEGELSSRGRHEREDERQT